MRKLQIEDPEVMRIANQQEIGRSEKSPATTIDCTGYCW